MVDSRSHDRLLVARYFSVKLQPITAMPLAPSMCPVGVPALFVIRRNTVYSRRYGVQTQKSVHTARSHRYPGHSPPPPRSRPGPADSADPMRGEMSPVRTIVPQSAAVLHGTPQSADKF